MDILIHDQLKNDFLRSFKRSLAFSNLPIQLQAQISKDSMDPENKSLIDCCRFCGIKLNMKTTRIQIKKRKKKQKSSKLFIICQGCQRIASNPIQFPSQVLMDYKDERTTNKTLKNFRLSKSAHNLAECNTRAALMSSSYSQLKERVMRQTIKVNKLHLLARKDSKPVCNSLSSFLKSFR